VLLDVKAGNADLYDRVTTGGNFHELLEFAGRLVEHGTRLWIRFVLVPGLTDAVDNVGEVADLCADIAEVIDRVEVLPYHTLGVDKYAAVGRSYALLGTPTPTPAQVESALTIFRERGLYAIA
jgi:pyruvate formate lyase activating enzyme